LLELSLELGLLAPSPDFTRSKRKERLTIHSPDPEGKKEGKEKVEAMNDGTFTVTDRERR